MPTTTPEQFYAAKTPKPSHMRTADWDRVQLAVRERAFFMAAVTHAEILEVFRVAVGKVLTGELSEAEARREIREGLARHGYTPKPGDEGTIKDLSTLKRQDVVIRTNISIARNWAAYQKQWKARRAFPAKRMVRLSARRVPRDWKQRWEQAARGLMDADAESMTALLDSPVWVRLNRFGANYAPYDFGSGMGDLAVRRDEAEALLGKDVVAVWLGEKKLEEPEVSPGTVPDEAPGATEPPPGENPGKTPDASPPVYPQLGPAPQHPGGTAPAPSPFSPPGKIPPAPGAPDAAPAPAPGSIPVPSSPGGDHPTPIHPGELPAPVPPAPEFRPSPESVPVTPVPPGRPGPGMNSTLEVTPAVTTPEGRQELSEILDGLAVWDGDKLVYLDPNGTRPYPADVIPRIIGATNFGGIPNKQEDALLKWASGGAAAILGTALAAYFADLVWRTLPMTSNETLTLTSVFRTAEARAAAVEKLPEGGTWQPATSFPFLALAKAGAVPVPAEGFALTAQIVRHQTARDLTPAVDALAGDEPTHGHNVLIPGGAVFRVENVQASGDAAPVIITLIEEGGPQP